MFRQTNRSSALVPLLTAFLLAVLLPATASAGISRDGGNPGVVIGAAGAGPGGDPGGGPASGDPDELGIYRAPQPPVWSPGPASPSVPRTDEAFRAWSLKSRLLCLFLLGCFRTPGR